MTAVKNNSLEELKHKNVIRNYQDYAIAHNNSFDYDVDNYILYSELNQQLQKELDKFPKEMREVFEIHRFKNKKYHEILYFFYINKMRAFSFATVLEFLAESN